MKLILIRLQQLLYVVKKHKPKNDSQIRIIDKLLKMTEIYIDLINEEIKKDDSIRNKD